MPRTESVDADVVEAQARAWLTALDELGEEWTSTGRVTRRRVEGALIAAPVVVRAVSASRRS